MQKLTKQTLKALAQLPLSLLLAYQEHVDEKARVKSMIGAKIDNLYMENDEIKTKINVDQPNKIGVLATVLDSFFDMIESVNKHDAARQSVLNLKNIA